MFAEHTEAETAAQQAEGEEAGLNQIYIAFFAAGRSAKQGLFGCRL